MDRRQALAQAGCPAEVSPAERRDQQLADLQCANNYHATYISWGRIHVGGFYLLLKLPGVKLLLNYALAAETKTDLGVVISSSWRFKPTPVQSATAADCISCVLLTH
jgi:hypothetical protein